MSILFSLLAMVSLVLAACTAPATSAPTQASQPTAASPATEAPKPTEAPQAAPVTLRILIHQNPPLTEFMENFNADFQAKHPNITVDMAVVAPGDLSQVTQTRLTANDVDIVDMAAFDNAAKPYMKNVTPPGWQTLIENGLLMDLSDQPFIKNYDPAAIKDAGSYNGNVYEINLGRVGFSGIFYNKKLFAEHNVKVPTTFNELVAACETFKKANIPCMTAGGKDGWPIFVGAYGLLGAIYPDQEALVEGLWTGAIKWNDEKSLEMWRKMQIYARDMLEPDASGIAGDEAPGRFASGAVAMLGIGGTWYAPAIDAAQPDFEYGYFPWPGSDNPEDNKYLFGKYDMGWVVAANTPNKEAAMLYLTEFSEPAKYQEFVNAVGFIPTQPTATLDTPFGKEVAPLLPNFRISFEKIWVAPKGAGEFANPWASYFKPFGTFDDPKALADQAQADLEAGLKASSQ
jgi:raffinose/stachyose/melibiose transport system substrate-binding protein